MENGNERLKNNPPLMVNMDIVLILIILIVGIALLALSYGEKSILLAGFGSTFILIVGMILINSGIDMPNGNTQTAVLNMTSGSTTDGVISSTNLVTMKTDKSYTIQLSGLMLVFFSIISMLFIRDDYRTRGDEN
jgi:hypothetical protein